MTVAVVFAGCAVPKGASSPAGHGTLSELSRVEGEVVLCDHRVPEKVCTRHHPELVSQFKRAGDWCPPHQVPESQCLECHPDLTFEALPKVPANADIAWVSRQGEDVPLLEPLAVKGKPTLFDFYADWCAACRKVTGHVYKRLAKNDALAYRKINVVSWESPVAQRYLRDVPSLPLLIVFDRSGRRVGQLSGANLDALDALLEGTRE